MLLKQLSIFVENKQGRLAEITKVLGDNKIDIRAISIADTTDYGIMRLIVNHPEEAEKILKESGSTVSLTEVIGVAVDDRPGALSDAVQLLSDSGISIEYMYAFLNPTNDNACVILRVEDNDKALDVFEKNGVSMVSPDKLYEI